MLQLCLIMGSPLTGLMRFHKLLHEASGGRALAVRTLRGRDAQHVR